MGAQAARERSPLGPPPPPPRRADAGRVLLFCRRLSLSFLYVRHFCGFRVAMSKK